MDYKVKAIIPCYNEELTVGDVISELKSYLPTADIYVFDNNSTDRTAAIAEARGATVIKEKRQGKGFVVQSMFQKVDADIYVMVDGDYTYDLTHINEMISLIRNDEADMVVGNRLKTYTRKSFRPLHTFGNKLVRSLVNKLFGANFKDIMSGLRVMSRDFAKNINLSAAGFEVETELTIKALKYNFIIREIDIQYRERPAGSFSKLSTVSDGLLVIRTIIMIFKDYKPLFFFSVTSFIFLMISLLAGSVVIQEFIETRYILHVPLAIFATGTMILSIIFFMTGIIADAVNRRFDELHNFIRQRGSKQ